MIDWINAGILGIVQGLTEFLPVSSSGHLVVFQQLLTEEEVPVVFDIILHLGTLLPIVWIYRAKIIELFRILFTNPLGPESRLGWFILLGSVPTALIGITLEDIFDQIFHTPMMVGIAFFITGSFLFATQYIGQGNRDEAEMTWKDALIIGVVQGLAITPGISRSGSTISVAMLLGLRRDLAAKFSFLLSIPAIVGGFILKSREIASANLDPLVLGVGFATSALVGVFALQVLLRLVNSGDFSKFAYYMWLISVVAIFVL
jgi:undecaprenyl-diphosphatase